MEHVFAVTLKAKMAWFNHAGVYGPHGDFVDFFALDPIELHDSRHGLIVLGALPGVVPRSRRWMKSHRLEPRVTFRSNAELLGDFSFKEMELGTIRRQRFKSIVFQLSLGQVQLAMDAIGQNGEQAHLPARFFDVAEQGGHAHAFGHAFEDRIPKSREC
jgi:hypothetical protein